MKRREFLAAGAGVLSAVAVPSRLFGQQARVRTAVVIGVDRVGHFPALRGAASGAQQVGDWLRSEGFETIVFSDRAAPVRVNDIFDVIAAQVNRSTLDQLVVYFAGHGFASGYSEFWMLSNAPDNPNEAISLTECVALARLSGIPNVVFISDACRSRVDSLSGERVRGSLIFPNRRVVGRPPSDVDQFLATLVGDPSFEVPVGDNVARHEGIYTAAFLGAFSRPDGAMVHTIDGIEVVPNNRLKAYLEREVRTRAQAINLPGRQIPDTQVVSNDSTYIGQVRRVDPPVPPPITDQPATVQQLAIADLQRFGIRGAMSGNAPTTASIERLSAEIGYTVAGVAVRRPGDTSRLGRRGGFWVSGAVVTSVVSSPSIQLERLDAGDGQGQPGLIRINSTEARARAGSVAMRFADGTGTVVAALDGFVASVSVDRGQVVDVSYLPATGTFDRPEYDRQRPRVDTLHAAVASAARFGVFRIEGGPNRAQTANDLATRIRNLKGVDPTLGVYAAYAYSEAGLPGQIQSVRSIMRDEMGIDLFDVAMLADALNGRAVTGSPTFPFCPMLSQGWNLIRVKDVRLESIVNSARDDLRQALWTTFGPRGISLLASALANGSLR
jgi:hypothetical protein